MKLTLWLNLQKSDYYNSQHFSVTQISSSNVKHLISQLSGQQNWQKNGMLLNFWPIWILWLSRFFSERLIGTARGWHLNNFAIFVATVQLKINYFINTTFCLLRPPKNSLAKIGNTNGLCTPLFRCVKHESLVLKLYINSKKILACAKICLNKLCFHNGIYSFHV